MNILIVEDDNDILDFLKTSLKSEGFVVDTAEDGNNGFYKASKNEYDLIILDIGLPYKNGRQICSAIRSLGKETPILILSVQGELDTKIDLLNIGADDYVVKPFSYAELLARIKALMRRPRTMQNEIVRINDLTLDTSNRTVTRGGKQIHLTPKEFFLLEYLVRNRGRTLSRTAILEHVWDVNADPFTNTLETHIASLRKKLGRENKKSLIQTVSGTGYKID